MTTKALLALAGSIIAFASPASAAQYFFSANGNDYSGAYALEGSFTTSNAQTLIYNGAEYEAVVSVTLKKVAFTTTSFDWETYEEITHNVDYSDITLYPNGNVLMWTAYYNHDRQDFAGQHRAGTPHYAIYYDETDDYNLALDNFGSDGINFDVSVGASRTFRAPELTVSVAPTAAVPEPTTWAMMIGGFGLAGGAMRRRQRQALRFA